MGTHEGPFAHPHVFSADTHKILEGVLSPGLLGRFFGVASLHIAELEASEEVGVLEVEVAEVPEIVEDEHYFGTHPLPALEWAVAWLANLSGLHYLGRKSYYFN